jgi:hypothetical protein
MMPRLDLTSAVAVSELAADGVHVDPTTEITSATLTRSACD